MFRKYVFVSSNIKFIGFFQYDGYTSCPLITGFGKCILAEFDFNGKPLETFPMDQGKERRFAYMLKKDVMPSMYWHMLIK
jgi:sulfide:quinone oxidoreductase